MVVRGCVGAAVLIVALAACAAKPVAPFPGPEAAAASSGPAVLWQGHQLREVTSLAALPPSIRQALGADKRGSGGIAEKGRSFNASDVVIVMEGVEEDPMRRFVTSGHDGDTWLVAFEQGGIVHSVWAVEISGGVPRRKWSLSCCMTTLAEVVQQVSAAPSDSMFVLKP